MNDIERGTQDRRVEDRGIADRQLSFPSWLARPGQRPSTAILLAQAAPAFSPVGRSLPPVTIQRAPVVTPPPPQIRYAPNPYERGVNPRQRAEPTGLDEQLIRLREQLAEALQQGQLPSEGPERPRRSALAAELFGTGQPAWVWRAAHELERPVATLARGGKAPAFIDVGPPTVVMVAGQELIIRPRVLHVLDAIAYEVSRARSEQDLDRVLRRYLERPPLPLRPDKVMLDPAWEVHLGPVFPPSFDPDLAVRTATYARAVRTRTKTQPQLAQAPSARVATAEREVEVERRRRPACTGVWLPRAEGSPSQVRHNQFAAYMVTKLRIPGASPELDYRIWRGGDRSTDYDSYDFLSRTYYEFKTRFEYVPFGDLPSATEGQARSTWFAMSRIVAQAQDQASTIATCDPGARLVWIFDNEAVANAARPAIAPFVDGVAATKWNAAKMP